MSGIDEAEALAIGREYGQAAVFAWSPEAWQVVSCTDDRRHRGGWHVMTDLAPSVEDRRRV